jgi:hypothetical protein
MGTFIMEQTLKPKKRDLDMEEAMQWGPAQGQEVYMDMTSILMYSHFCNAKQRKEQTYGYYAVNCVTGEDTEEYADKEESLPAQDDKSMPSLNFEN